MHERIRAFVDSAVESFALQGPICQVGIPAGDDLHSCGLSGQQATGAARSCFRADATTGAGRLPFSDGVARTVLCVGDFRGGLPCQRSAEEIARILAPGGALLVCITLPDVQPSGKPGEWRSTPRSVQQLLAGTSATVVGWQGAEAFPHTMYGVGFKPPLATDVMEGTRRFLDRFQARLQAVAGQVAWRKRLRHFLIDWTRSRSQRRDRRDCHKIQFAVHLCADESLKQELLRNCFASEQTGTRLDLMD
jgi:hypothetical protein